MDYLQDAKYNLERATLSDLERAQFQVAIAHAAATIDLAESLQKVVGLLENIEIHMACISGVEITRPTI